jgi:hypothetical protein
MKPKDKVALDVARKASLEAAVAGVVQRWGGVDMSSRGGSTSTAAPG